MKKQTAMLEENNILDGQHSTHYSCSQFYLQAWLSYAGTIQLITTHIFSTALMKSNMEKSDTCCSEHTVLPK